jgi:hypothetical protein
MGQDGNRMSKKDLKNFVKSMGFEKDRLETVHFPIFFWILMTVIAGSLLTIAIKMLMK